MRNQISPKISDLAEKMILSSLIRPSSQFGDLVLEVDHRKLGQLAKELREKHDVQAVQVARILNISKVIVHFMETGRKQWTKLTLSNYLAAIHACQTKKKSEKKGKK